MIWFVVSAETTLSNGLRDGIVECISRVSDGEHQVSYMRRHDLMIIRAGSPRQEEQESAAIVFSWFLTINLTG
jgi:hypothetical protein